MLGVAVLGWGLLLGVLLFGVSSLQVTMWSVLLLSGFYFILEDLSAKSDWAK